MPVTKQHPPPAQPWQRETAPAAPFLTSNNTCSVCNVRPMSCNAGKVCPNCYALLDHEDWSTAERARNLELKLQRIAAERERRMIRQQHKHELAEQRRQARSQTTNEALQRIHALAKGDEEQS